MNNQGHLTAWTAFLIVAGIVLAFVGGALAPDGSVYTWLLIGAWGLTLTALNNVFRKIRDKADEQQIRTAPGPSETTIPVTTREELGLLRSYADGPKIWDAASLVPELAALAAAGLIEPAPPEDDGSPPSRGAYQITEAGRQVLADGTQDKR